MLTLIHAIAAGADSIDDTDVVHSGGGGSEALLGHKAMAPSILGAFLRAFTFGHMRQLDRVLGEATAGHAGPERVRGWTTFLICVAVFSLIQRPATPSA